jgi:hypothetical protein
LDGLPEIIINTLLLWKKSQYIKGDCWQTDIFGR